MKKKTHWRTLLGSLWRNTVRFDIFFLPYLIWRIKNKEGICLRRNHFSSNKKSLRLLDKSASVSIFDHESFQDGEMMTVMRH